MNFLIKNKAIIISIIISYILAITLIFYMTNQITSANIPAGLLFILIIPFTYKSINHFITNKYIPYIEGIFGIITSIILFIGKSIYETHTLEYLFDGLFRLFFGIVGGSILFLLFFDYFYRIMKTILDRIILENKNNFVSKRTFIIMYLILFATYIFVFLIYYPGIFSYDATNQTKQALGFIDWDTHHPVLHTFLWMVCIKLGRFIGIEGLVIYSIGSIIVVVSTYMAVITKLFKSNIPKIVCIVCYLYYLLV